MKTKNDLVADLIFLIVLLMAIIGVILSICEYGKEQEVVLEVTTQATTEETTEYISESTQNGIAVTEATEPSIKLYDVPLDEDLQLHIISEAEAHGIDPAIIMAMAYRESTYRPDAIGDGGKSYGLLQVQLRWHYDRMLKLDSTNLLDPYQNVKVAVDYLAEKLDNHGGDIAKALTAYNKGHYPGYITEYARDVMAKAEGLAVK